MREWILMLRIEFRAMIVFLPICWQRFNWWTKAWSSIDESIFLLI